ncbi:hypothetical protein P692DRAFT_20438548 [Suillus brevipes Sb2]|nr:hypothetical protein P692DRAFT_20438548 [Suillus brevipes Sb2]
MHLICASVVAVCFVLEFLCIMIRRHGPMTQACEATDQVSDILSFDSYVLYHGVLSDLSCAMPLNGPCSTG